MIARQKRAAAIRAHRARVIRAKKVIARAKKEGWFKRGQSIKFWTSRSAWNLRRQWLVNKRRAAQRKAAAARAARIKRQRLIALRR